MDKPTTFASLLKKTFLEIKGKQGTHRKLQTIGNGNAFPAWGKDRMGLDKQPA